MAERVNIMDLAIGEIGISDDGSRWRVIRDVKERRPALGRVTVRIAEDQNGKPAKFIRGITVVRASPPRDAGQREETT